MLYAIYYGYSIAEIIWEKSNGLIFIKDIKARRPERFRFGNDGNIYLRNKSTLNGVLMPDKKFWVAVHGAETSDDVYGKGLSQALYWPHIFKSNGLKFWMSFLERFGSPTAIAKMSPGSMSDPNLIHKVQSALEGLAQEGSIITPNTVDIELLQASVGTGVTDYNSLRIAMDDAISKIVIGQTMTTDKGSSYSQSEIHKSVRDEILEADSDLLSESFNRTVSVWFTEYNFEGATPPRLFRLTERKDDILKVVEKDIKIKDLGWNPRDEYIIKTYGDGYEKAHDIVHNEDKKDQQFSEKDLISISRENHERAMDEIEKASLDFGLNYQELIGYRVKEIQDIAEASGDFGLFKQRLSELAQEDPKESIVKKIMSGRIFARLYGMFNAMRKK
ncbi:DUF935 family protein [bacterium]|nr:DUF935 family protein [bacterium]